MIGVLGAPILLLAPTSHGKTEYVLNRIHAVRSGAPLAPIWVILPNQMQVRAFGRRLGTTGGALGVELGTFYRFYAEILARSGQPVARLRDAVLHRLLLRLVDQQAEAGQIQHYAPLRRRPGFARLLRELFQELKQARVQREAFETAVVRLGPDSSAGSEPGARYAPQPTMLTRLRELGSLYAAYQEWLIRSDWMDAEGQGWLAALALERDPTLVPAAPDPGPSPGGQGLRLLIVDGFDEFNPTQLAVLSLLAGRAAETVITLTGDLACEDRTAHRRFCRARHALQQALHLEPQPLPGYPSPDSHPAHPLAHLEASLFQPTPPCLPAGEAITCVEAPTRAAEARAALRWLKALLVREGYHLGEAALLARDLEPYRPYLAAIADEFGLPLHVAGGQPLARNPTMAAVLNLLSLPATNWPRRPLVDALACPYFDWSAQGIDPEAVRGLEAAARAGQVIAGLDQWREALARLARLRPHDEGQAASAADTATELDAAAPPDLPAGEQARSLQARLEAIAARLTPPANGTLGQYVAWVEDLVGEDPKLASRFRSDADTGDNSLHIVARAGAAGNTAERDVAALRRFKDVLRSLALAEAVLLRPGERAAPLDYGQFYVELRGAVEAARYELPAPPPGSALLAAPLLYARGLSFPAVALLGLAEGEFPRPEKQDPLLTERDRQALRAAGLPLESRLLGDEACLFYEAVTRARRYLLLTRPYLADDGQAWEASPYWDEVLRLVAARVLRLQPQSPLPATEAASLPEALLSAALGGAGDPSTLPGWERVLAAAEVVRSRKEHAPPGLEAPSPEPWDRGPVPGAGCPWEGGLGVVAPALAKHYGPHHIWSASRLETYATCPFLFFVNSVLDLEPRLPPSEGYDIRILGTMYHSILESTYRRALPEASPERLRALLPKAAEEVLAAAPDEHGFRPTALWNRQREELTSILAHTLEALIEATAGWQPVALEQAFGLKGQPCLDVTHGGRRLRLRGFVDRLDRDASGHLQVIDYKAGATPISARDLEQGKRLQLPLYALAVREALGLGEVGGGFYWHIGSAQPSSLRLESYPMGTSSSGQGAGGTEGAMQTALEHALDIAEAVRAGKFPPQPPAGGCPESCPAAAFCWHYAPRRW